MAAQGQHYIDHLKTIQALIEAGNVDEADCQFEELLRYKFNIADRLSKYPAIAARYAERLAAYPVLSTMKKGFGFEASSRLFSAKWSVPTEMDRDQLRVAIRQLCETVVAAPVEGPARVVTFGSCFAANLALELERMGVDAASLLVEETINSPDANLHLLRAMNGMGEHALLAHFGQEFIDRTAAKLETATHIVMTLGVAPRFISRFGGFVFAADYRRELQLGNVRMETPAVEDVVAILREIVKLLRRLNDRAALVFTVSPVPLSGSTEYPSAIIADCVSKSTLRAAIDRICRDTSVTYFPSFEIVRWLAPYSVGHFGADDRVSRHVSGWLVKEIVAAFVERFGIAPGEAA